MADLGREGDKPWSDSHGLLEEQEEEEDGGLPEEREELLDPPRNPGGAVPGNEASRDPVDWTTDSALYRAARPVRVGRVVVFVMRSPGPPVQTGKVACLVVGVEEQENGAWASVKLLGVENEGVKAQAQAAFSRKKLPLHLCAEEGCEVGKAVHLRGFTVWPEGAFHAPWADKKAMKDMGKFLQREKGPPPESPPVGEGQPGSATAKLAQLRQRVQSTSREAGGTKTPRAVHFAPLVEQTVPPGILKRTRMIPIKGEETIPVSSSEAESSLEERAQKKMRSVGGALAAAVAKQNAEVLAPRTSRTGAGSSKRHSPQHVGSQSPMVGSPAKKKKKKKSKKKKRKNDSGSSSDSEDSSSGSSDLKPPLQRKAEKKPGSVLRMLMEQVVLSLSDISLAEGELADGAAAVNASAKVLSYYQVAVRPHLQHRARDDKELHTLATCLDTPRQGQLERLGDLLAGRYLAVETAALEGSWDTARHLEVCKQQVQGAVPDTVRLAARKHQKTLDKAAGKGSFSSSSRAGWEYPGSGSSGWAGEEWKYSVRGKGGVTKGKGKDGKNKKGKGGGKKGQRKDSSGEPPGEKE